MNKTNVLAVGVLLIAISLFLQVLYYNPQGNMREILEGYGITIDFFTLLITGAFLAGIAVSIASILIKPKKRKIIVSQAYEKPLQRELAYGEEATDTELEQPYVEEELPQVEAEEEEAVERGLEAGEKDMDLKEGKKPREVIGFCPRCGAPVIEGIRYCRKCGLKLK